MVFQKNAAFNRHHWFENSINTSHKFQKTTICEHIALANKVIFQT